jgi:hypothetical protein
MPNGEVYFKHSDGKGNHSLVVNLNDVQSVHWQDKVLEVSIENENSHSNNNTQIF